MLIVILSQTLIIIYGFCIKSVFTLSQDNLFAPFDLCWNIYLVIIAHLSFNQLINHCIKLNCMLATDLYRQQVAIAQLKCRGIFSRYVNIYYDRITKKEKIYLKFIDSLVTWQFWLFFFNLRFSNFINLILINFYFFCLWLCLSHSLFRLYAILERAKNYKFKWASKSFFLLFARIKSQCFTFRSIAFICMN